MMVKHSPKKPMKRHLRDRVTQLHASQLVKVEAPVHASRNKRKHEDPKRTNRINKKAAYHKNVSTVLLPKIVRWRKCVASIQGYC